MSTRFLEALNSGKVILMDGAMGTELIRRGLPNPLEDPAYVPFPQLNLTRPRIVRQVHRDYVKAGAKVLLTNTFVANTWDRHNRFNPVRQRQRILMEGLRLARACIGAKGFVLGSLGPPCFLQPRLDDTLIVKHTVICTAALAQTDGVLLETQSWTILATEVMKQLPRSERAPLLASFAFHKHRGRIITNALHNRESPEEVCRWACKHRRELASIGLNCGLRLPLDDITRLVRLFRRRTGLPVLLRPNAGFPQFRDGVISYPRSPERFAKHVERWVDAGVTLLGGCCGTTPAHIAAMGEVLDKLGELWKPAERRV